MSSSIRLDCSAFEDARVSSVRRGAFRATVSLRLVRNPRGAILSALELDEARRICRLNTAAIDAELRRLGYNHAAFDDIRSATFCEILDNRLIVPKPSTGKTHRAYRTFEGCRQTLRIVAEAGRPVAEEWVSAEAGLAAEFTPCGMVALVKPVEAYAGDGETMWEFDDGPDEAAIKRDGGWLAKGRYCFRLFCTSPFAYTLSYGPMNLNHGFRAVTGGVPKYKDLPGLSFAFKLLSL